MYKDGLCPCTPVHWRTGSRRSAIIDSCELPHGDCDLNSGPLEEQSILLTAEPPLQALILATLIGLSNHRWLVGILMDSIDHDLLRLKFRG